jgi:hypothetical protein
MRTTEQELDTRELRRLRADDRRLSKLERLESKCAPLIGELCREGGTVYYVNLTDRGGRFTGKTKESTSHSELVDYLIRNNYVT